MRVAQSSVAAVLLALAIGCSESSPIPQPRVGLDAGAVRGRDASPDLPPDAAPDAAPNLAPDAAPLAPPTTNLPAPWKHDDIGPVGASGASTLADGIYRVNGAGTDIWATSDGFTYVWRPFPGDGEIVAQVTGLSQTDAWAKAGVMLRESTTTTARHADMLVTAAHGSAFQFRTTDADMTLDRQASFAVPPRWLRLSRVGTVITGSFSADGMFWSVVARVEIDLPRDILVGLAVSSHVPGTPTEGIFEHVAITSYPPYPAGLDGGVPADAGAASDAPAPPAGPPVPPWTTGDIGTVGVPGTASQAGGTFTVTASGVDIWGTADSFGYVFQRIAGDAEVIARVVNLVPTNVWAKAGVMVRGSLDPGSEHVDIVATNPYGLQVQWRPMATSASTGVGAEFLGPPPQWVRLVRKGDTVDGFGSSDGVNWVPINSTDVPLPPVVYVGLVVTSHANTMVTTAVLDNVTVKGTPAPPPDGGGDTAGGGDGSAGQ